MKRYRARIKPDIQEMIDSTKKSQPYDEIMLALFYFEYWSQIHIVKKRRPFEIKAWVKKRLNVVMNELEVKV